MGRGVPGAGPPTASSTPTTLPEPAAFVLATVAHSESASALMPASTRGTTNNLDGPRNVIREVYHHRPEMGDRVRPIYDVTFEHDQILQSEFVDIGPVTMSFNCRSEA
jgi:hypothetical protein